MRRVVCMTSWPPRIGNVAEAVRALRAMTPEAPDEVFLTLSRDEFPKGEADLPTDLLTLAGEGAVTIVWVDGNRKAFKKVFPVLDRLDDDDLIMTCDDDVIAPPDLLASRLADFHLHGDAHPITSANVRSNCGTRVLAPTALFQKKMLAHWEEWVTEDVYATQNDDRTYLWAFFLNGYIAQPCTKYALEGWCFGQKMERLHLPKPMTGGHVHLIGGAYDNVVLPQIIKMTGRPMEESFGYFRRFRRDVLVVMPYAPSYATGNELETSVRGWHKHFKTPAGFRLVIVGEDCPQVRSLVEKGLAEHIERPTPRKGDGPEREFGAIARLVVECFGDEYAGFVKTDDDIYPVSDFTLDDVRTLKWIGTNLKGNPASANPFQRAMYATQEALNKHVHTTLNYCSHAPRYYECRKLAYVLNQYKCWDFPFLIEPLYFNIFNPSNAPKVNVNAAGNPLKYGIYGKLDPKGLKAALEAGVKWVNNSAPYYDERIIKAIEKHNEKE